MTFIEAIQSGFRNYVNFRGRASRSEFWYWLLFNLAVQIIADVAINETAGWMVTLALVLPTFAVGARRLHDIDRTGWWQILWLVPIIGWIVLIVWGCRKGTDGDNRFGPDPLPPVVAAAPAA